MDRLEKCLVDIDQLSKNSILKQQLSVSELIYKTAEHSNSMARPIDHQFWSIFPELDEGATQSVPAVFNPKFVIEVRDGNGFCVLDKWDPIVGLLPTRRVQCKYYIDVGQENAELSSILCGRSSSSCGRCPSVICCCGNGDCSSSRGCCCPGSIFKNMNASKHRGECRPYQNTTVTRTFEVDNYLNLFEPTTGLYIMCNKTAFPQFGFLARPNVFTSKRVLKEDWKYHNTWYVKLDERTKILGTVAQLLPDSYYEKLDFYNRFRSLCTTNTPSLSVDSVNDAPREDPRDVLIRELQRKLDELLRQTTLATGYNTELLEKYQSQSLQFMNLTRQLHSERAQVEINKSQLQQDLELENLSVQLGLSTLRVIQT